MIGGNNMITALHIKNIGIIEDLNIDFQQGLNVLTGETGAGKTLIIDSLQMVSGGRFSKEMIRKGEKYSFVELCLYEPENENAIEGNIIVSREIYASGRNMCKINGRMVTVTELKDFMKQFIEIHGQNENQDLLDNKLHLSYLDGFIGDKINNKKLEYLGLYEKYCDIKHELANNFGDEKERQRKLDLLEYQVKEIEEANLKVGEEEELEEKRKLIVNSEKIVENLQEADQLISENSIDSISMAIRALEKIELIDNKYEKASNDLKSIYYELQELSRDVNDYKNDIYFDEEERDFVEERLNLIYSLKRKYGNTIEEILKYCDEIKSEIEHIENLEEYNNKLRKEQKKLVEGMDKSLGDLLDYLEENPETGENTIILFMSDNGGQGLNNVRQGRANRDQNYPARAGKGSAFMGGVHEPMIVYWPGITKGGTQNNQRIMIEDFFPTILDMAGINKYTTIQTIDGISFIDMIKSPELRRERPIVWHFPNLWGETQNIEEGYGAYSAILKDDYHLIYSWETGRNRLYNIQKDIAEQTDLSAQMPEKVQELSQLLTQYLKERKAQRPTLLSSGKLLPYPDGSEN